MDFRIAVKALILDNDNNLLLVKRSSNDNGHPGIWEIPGGRLEIGESPFEGLKREVMEETNIQIEIEEPVSIRHFTNSADGVVITMIIFKCKALSKEVSLADGELSEFGWAKIKDAKSKLTKYFHKEIDALEKIMSA